MRPARMGLNRVRGMSSIMVRQASPSIMKMSEYPLLLKATSADSMHSPPLRLPVSFRTSSLPECNHSECFLLSYDIHRLHSTEERPPRIAIDPRVRVAYQRRWYTYQKQVNEIPVIKWWLGQWYFCCGLATADMSS